MLLNTNDLMYMKLFILLFLSILLIISLFNTNIYYSEAQESSKSNKYLPQYYNDAEDSEIGIKLKYPRNWTLQYTNGNNNSLAMSNESFKLFIEDLEKFYKSENKDLNDLYPTNYEKYQFFLEEINTRCSLIMDCKLIEDTYLRSYFIDQTNILPFVNIFDYLPSMRFLSPIENSTDIFLDNVKIASFKLPHNLTLSEFIDSYYGYYYSRIPSFNSYGYNCQLNFSGYPGCQIIYSFIAGNNIEKIQYITSDFLIEKNQKIYLISYNSVTESYPKYIEIIKSMLESLMLV